VDEWDNCAVVIEEKAFNQNVPDSPEFEEGIFLFTFEFQVVHQFLLLSSLDIRMAIIQVYSFFNSIELRV
jgi:hypothetical protein